MIKIKCPNCGEIIEEELGITWGDACPFCMTTLIEPKPAGSTFGTTTLGDANAISGGIHNTDSHNVDSHNVTHITNYVQEKKDREEIAADNRNKFRELCKKIVKPGGRLSAEGKEALEDNRYILGLDEVTANAIIAEVKRSAAKTTSSTLSMLDRMILNNTKASIVSNSKTAGLNLNKIGPLAESCNDEEVIFYYNLLSAAKDPLCSVKNYETRKTDNYWQTYWVYMAYMSNGDVANAQRALLALKSWPDMPELNQLILGAAGNYNEIAGNEEALQEMLPYLTSENVDYSELLSGFKDAIVSLYCGNADPSNFYVDNFGFTVSPKPAQKEERETGAKAIKESEETVRVTESADDSRTAVPHVSAKFQSPMRDRTIPEILSDYRNDYGELRELTEEEKEVAFQEITRATNQGNEEAKLFLAQMYENGIGTDVDLKRAFDLYHSSAMGGFKPALIALGACYLYGIGVKKDVKEADKRLRLGMTTENPRIMKALGDLFAEKGSQTQADIWYKKALDNGIRIDERISKAVPSAKVDKSSTIAPIIQIKSIRLKDDAIFNGQNGFWVLISWVIDNLQNSRVTIAANFYWAVGAKILAGKSSFRSTDGQLSSFEETEPLPYESTSYDDFRLFMPYCELPTKRDGTFHLKLRIEVSMYSEFKKISLKESEDFMFDVIVNGAKISVR